LIPEEDIQKNLKMSYNCRYWSK